MINPCALQGHFTSLSTLLLSGILAVNMWLQNVWVDIVRISLDFDIPIAFFFFKLSLIVQIVFYLSAEMDSLSPVFKRL